MIAHDFIQSMSIYSHESPILRHFSQLGNLQIEAAAEDSGVVGMTVFDMISMQNTACPGLDRRPRSILKAGIVAVINAQ